MLLDAHILQHKFLQIRGRLYSQVLGRPEYVVIQTCDSGYNRFPLVEGLFAELRIQPFIHDCKIVVLEGRVVHEFRVFCKNHQHLSDNTSLQDFSWKGDLVIMRAGKKQRGSVVNMRGRDAGLADYAIRQ